MEDVKAPSLETDRGVGQSRVANSQMADGMILLYRCA